jgi:hypothetical protein
VEGLSPVKGQTMHVGSNPHLSTHQFPTVPTAREGSSSTLPRIAPRTLGSSDLEAALRRVGFQSRLGMLWRKRNAEISADAAGLDDRGKKRTRKGSRRKHRPDTDGSGGEMVSLCLALAW